MQKKTAVFGLIILGFASAMLCSCFPSEEAKPVYTTAQITRLLTNDSSKVWFLMDRSVVGSAQSLPDCALQDTILLSKAKDKNSKNKSVIPNDSVACLPNLFLPASGTWEVLDEGLSNYPQDSIQTTSQVDLQGRILLLTTHTFQITYKRNDSTFEEMYQSYQY